ncbi:Cyclic nucleotide-binding domain-containing protein [Lentzea fradiae]|uniref:Cyclic nucleotide-binding domain-containing protein n=1 Tax=Lentzea fradiae TaxID=200378 RepID=A0A1G8DQP3_9PSEU|nr:cyclic nucleotide-binding domain-containing protein [Lentzea fradiae]SDH59769.1 Cyclic nucleotide-binding domain-containing protein [Lentzea fradiae]
MTTPVADLDALPLFACLSHTERAAIAGVSRIETYRSGTRLFDEGAPADRCWVVLSGCVVLDAADPAGGRVALQGIGPGELVGLSWLVPPHRWHFGGSVVSPTRAVAIDTAAVRELADDDPALGYRLSLVLLASMVERLHTTRLRLLDRHRGP